MPVAFLPATGRVFVCLDRVLRTMFLLYLDESGNEADPKDRFFVLAGLSLFERQTYFLTEAVEEVQNRHFPGHQPIIFHASEIRSGRGFWRKVPEDKRKAVLQDLCTAIADVPDKSRFLYAAAIEKSDRLWGEDAVEKATEELCRRFDIFLQRKYHEDEDPQRGLLVFSEGRFDARAKVWVRGFHQRGTTWGAIRNLADIPYFARRLSRPFVRVPGVCESREPRYFRGLVGRWVNNPPGSVGSLARSPHTASRIGTSLSSASTSSKRAVKCLSTSGAWVMRKPAISSACSRMCASTSAT